MFEAGLNLHREQPCQKQPSTKTASRTAGKTKSGCPNIAEFRRQPLIPYLRNSSTTRISVVRFAFERICDMFCDRCAFVCTSVMLLRVRPQELIAIEMNHMIWCFNEPHLCFPADVTDPFPQLLPIGEDAYVNAWCRTVLGEIL